MKIVKATDEKRLKLIEDLYMRAFPKSERKPFKLMVQKQTEGTMELLSIEEENDFLGLAIFAHDKDIALLDYFAISDDCLYMSFYILESMLPSQTDESEILST